MNKLIVVVALVLIVAGAGWQYFKPEAPQAEVPSAQAPDGSLVITLTDDGFSPAEAHTKAGQPVVFKTTTGKAFWPASNPHPSHTIYPKFDPEQPIQPASEWVFTPTKVGSWGYHDHLAPYYRGTLVVE